MTRDKPQPEPQTCRTLQPEQVYLCDRCGHTMYELNCKIICPNCGYRFDCSDLNIYFD